MDWQHIRRDLLLALSSQAFYKLVGFLVLLILTRYLPKEQMGVFFFAATVGTLLLLFTELGTSSFLIRSVAAAPESGLRLFSGVLALRLPLFALYLLAMVAFAGLIRPDIFVAVVLTSFYVLLEEFYRSAGALFLGLKRVAYNVTAGVTTRLLLIGFILVVVHLQGSLYAILACYIAANACLLAVGLYLVKTRLGSLAGLSDKPARREILRLSFPLFLVSVLSLFHFKIDSVMLGFLRSYSEVATYEAAFRILEASRFVIVPVGMILFPWFSELAARERWSEMQAALRTVLFVSAGLGAVATVAMFILGGVLVPFAFGDQYVDSVSVLKILYLSVPMIYGASVLILVAKSLHREIKAARVLFYCLLLNVALNLYFIPRWGAVGAATTTVMTETVLVVAVFRLALSALRRRSIAEQAPVPG